MGLYVPDTYNPFLLFALVHVLLYTTIAFVMVKGWCMDQVCDWYEAVVIDNSVLGSSFVLNDMCVFRCVKNKKFEVFNLKDTSVVVSGKNAKTQLRSKRDRNNQVIRTSDQGYVNWKYSSTNAV